MLDEAVLMEELVLLWEGLESEDEPVEEEDVRWVGTGMALKIVDNVSMSVDCANGERGDCRRFCDCEVRCCCKGV